MMVRCVFGLSLATLRGRRWYTKDLDLYRRLELLTEDPPAQGYDRELWIAERMCDRLDGSIIEHKPDVSPEPYEKGAVY
jgi:hypothetical protein